MKIHYFIMFVFLTHYSCQNNSELPKYVKNTQLESKYNDIKWELYKSVLHCGGRIDYNTVTKKEPILLENLTELSMSLDTVILSDSDELSLIHFFKLDDDLVVPICRNVANNTFIYKLTYNSRSHLTEYSTGNVTFKVNDTSIEELVDVSDEEFIIELRKRNKINRWLKSELKRRGYTL